jgi:hypothetical protein
MQLKCLRLDDRSKRVTFPLNIDTFLFANALHLLLIIGSKKVRPTLHVGNVKVKERV